MKIGLLSLGCPKNLVDSEVMLGLAHQAGHEITHDAADADVLVVNTCAFIESAKQESIDAILEMAELKKAVPGRRLIVTGCLAERYRGELQALIPDIDAVLGTGEVPQIVAAIGGAAASSAAPLMFYGSRPIAATAGRGAKTPDIVMPQTPSRESRPTYLYDANTPRLLATPRHYAYVKIAEGCDYACAFCIIPTLRGSYRSRTTGSIVQEARMLAGRGARELLLVSQDTTFYGVDRRERGALASLLRELETVDGLEWIRLLYLYPTTIDDATLDVMAESTKVCKYIDLPLQHASDRVLRQMGRPGRRASYDTLLRRIRDRVPGVAIRTTFIVGFPGETDDDVDQICRFIDDQQFDHVGTFTYSHEEGTPAFDRHDDVPSRIKAARRAKVMRAQKRVVTARQKARVGERARLLVDGPSGEHELVLRGRLSTQAPDIDPVVYLTDCDPSQLRAGDFVEVEIVGANDYDLVARPVAAVAAVAATI